MRKRWIYINGEAIPAENYEPQPSAGVFVWDDHKPYQSMATGEVVEGRAQHREHLKRNGLVEVGDAYDKGLKPKPIPVAPGLREIVGRLVYEKLRY